MKNLPVVYFPTNVALLTALLDSLEQDLYEPSENRCAPLKPNWEAIDRRNTRRQNKELSRIYGGRKAFCLFTSMYTIYAKSEKDVELIKRQARALGYKNLKTFVPKLPDPLDKMKSIDDPDHPFAVEIMQRESQIIGELAKNLINLHKPVLEIVQDHIIYTYAHSGDLRYTTATEIEAGLVLLALVQHFENGEKYAKKVNKQLPPYDIRMEQTELDRWTVYLTIKGSK